MLPKTKSASAIMVGTILLLLPQFTLYAQDAGKTQGVVCSAKGLSGLLDTDISTLTHKKLVVDFSGARVGADIDAYYMGDALSVVNASFMGSGGKADMNFYFQNKKNYLMEYHIIQNSNFFEENDSVVLTDEKSYYHVCDEKLLTAAFGGIVNEEIFDNMKLVLDVILTQEGVH